jgi:predicted ATPase
MLHTFVDGVFFAPLGSISDPGLVVPAIAQALQLKEVAGRPLIETLAAALRNKHTLLVLDNFEQVLAAARGIDHLLDSCPGVKILVTSREGLHLYGEHHLPVPPLALPDLSGVPEGELGAESDLAQVEAVRLFIDRARAVQPEFAPTNEDILAIAHICHRLDGLPLAIELAAARSRMLSPRAMLARLERRLPLLVGGAQSLPSRQRTLRDTIAWSYAQLSEVDRRLFRRLAVFVGGCTLEAAESVCNAEGEASIDALEAGASLADKSLLRLEEQGDGEPRVMMLETIREFAQEQLEASGEAPTFRQRHAEYYLSLAESANPRMWGAEQTEWLVRLDTEHDNMRAALSWSEHDAVGVAVGLRLAGALMRFWYIRGHFTECRRWLEVALAAGGDAPNPVRGRALNLAGILAFAQGDYGRATELFEESLVLLREQGDIWGIALGLGDLGLVAHDQGDYRRGAELFTESLDLFRQAGDTWGTAWCYGNLGRLAYAQGDYDGANIVLDQGLVLRRELGDKWGMAWSLATLGSVAQARNDFARAAELFDASLVLRQELKDKRTIGLSLGLLGRLALEQGKLEAALELLDESLTCALDVEDKHGIAAALYGLAKAAWYQGNRERAAAVYRDSLTRRHELRDMPGIADCLAGLAEIAGEQGQLVRAARLMAPAVILREAIGAVLSPSMQADRMRVHAAVRAGLGEEAFVAAWAEGQAMSLEQAIAFALEESPSE